MPNGDLSILSESSKLTVFPGDLQAVRRIVAECNDNHAEALDRARADGIVCWEGRAQVRKFRGDSVDEADLYEVVDGTPNLLVYGGASALWHRVIGGTTVTAFSNALAYLAVGDSTTAAVNTQTGLIGTTNTLFMPMDATFPQHTDGTGASTNAQCKFQGTASTSQGNWAGGWQEWGVFNANTSGRMLQRKVEALGTKTSASTWQLLVTLTLA